MAEIHKMQVTLDAAIEVFLLTAELLTVDQKEREEDSLSTRWRVYDEKIFFVPLPEQVELPLVL